MRPFVAAVAFGSVAALLTPPLAAQSAAPARPLKVMVLYDMEGVSGSDGQA